MSHHDRKQRTATAAKTADTSQGVPGRSAPAARLPALARAPAPDALVQADGELELDGAEAQAIASAGVAGGGALPFLAQIQAAFGRHEVSSVRAQVGGTARDASAALGANAYAIGDRVGFARDPDLFLAAHEAAHVVQQRGGVQLSGGIGARGDRHEQHADAVGAAVVAGESAESLLDQYAGASGAPVIQRNDPDDEAPALRISELRHLGRGRWVHADGRPLAPRERTQLREALVRDARDRGMPDEDVGRYRAWLDNRANPPLDPQTWRDHHLPIQRDHERAWRAQDAALPEGHPDRNREAPSLMPADGDDVAPIPRDGSPRAREGGATSRPLGTEGDDHSFSVPGEDGHQVHRADMQHEVVAPGDDACTTSGADSCAVTSMHHDAPGGDRLRLGHPAAATGGPQYDHVEESVVRAARQGGDIRGVVRIDPRAQQRPSPSDRDHVDDDFHTFPHSNDELRDRLAARLARDFGAENVSREGAHIVVRGDDGQVRSRISIGIVHAPQDAEGNPQVQHVTLTRNGTAIGNASDAAPQTIPHHEAHEQGEEDDAAPGSDAAPTSASRTPAVATRPTIPVGGAPASDAERERGAGLARNLRHALTRRTRDGSSEERARAAQGLRDLDALGDAPSPDAVRRVADAAGVPAVDPDHEPAEPRRTRARSAPQDDDAQPEVGLDGVSIPTAGGGETQVGIDHDGASVNVRDRRGRTGGAALHVQHGADGIEGGDVALTAGQGDVRGTLGAGVTYVARRPRRSGNRYSVSWNIEIRAQAALHGRLRGMGVGVSRGGAITREGTDLFETVDAANEFRASFRDFTDDRIIERFFRTARGDQGTHAWWTEQPTGTSRSVQIRATLTPSIKGKLAEICEVGLSIPMAASASAQVRKTDEGAVEVTESFEVGAGIDPSLGAAGIGVHGTLGTGIDNNVRYRVTYVFAVDLGTGRAAFERFLARSGLIWEGQAGVTEVSHARTTETRETFGANAGPFGHGDGERGTSTTVTEGPDGEQHVSHRGFQQDVYNDMTGTYGRRGMEVEAPTDDRPYQIRTDVHSNEGEASGHSLGEATGTHDAAASDELRSSGNWVVNEQLTQAQAAEFHRNFIRGGRPRGGWLAVGSLYNSLREVATGASGRDARASAISDFVSREGRRGLDFIYGFLRQQPTQEVRLFTRDGEDTNFMREADLRAMERRIPGYEQAIADGRGATIAARIQQDIHTLEPRLAAVSDRSRYTDLNDELRDRITTRYRAILDRLRPLHARARSGQAPRREAAPRREFHESNLTANAPGSSVPVASVRLSAPSSDEDRDILDHIEVQGLHVVVDDRPFYLDAGIEVAVIAARRAGDQGGMTRWRVTLRITDPMPGVDTIEAHAEEGTIPNRAGQQFHRVVLGRERDPAPGAAPVQGKGGLGGGDVHATAAHGIAGAGAALPFLDQIQRAFGRHDVSAVRAHVGGAATAAANALGAEAYATGDAVAFRGTPDLHTAAHEAAHVIQQRGEVELAGGVGAPGDAYERHADEVADAVIAGRSAQELLDMHAGGGPGVQRRAVQLVHRAGQNDSESVSLVMAVAEGRELPAMRALHHALEQAARRRTTSGDDDHVVCVAGRDDYDLVLSQPSADGLRATLARRMAELRGAADAAAIEQAQVPQSRDPGMSTPDRDPVFAERFNVEFHTILPSLREADRPMSGDARSPELTPEELHLMFGATQRAKLMRYFGDHVVPDRLFNGDDSGGCNAHQRIVISSHILSHGQIQEGSFAQDLQARYCGHWVQLVQAYAGVADTAGAGVANQIDHAGNQVMGTGRPHTEFAGAREQLTDEERGQSGSRRQFRQAGLPIERFDTIQPGDWLYVDTATDTVGGNHSVVFSRWLGELETEGAVQFRHAQLFGQQHVGDGGAQIEWYLGNQATTVRGRHRVYPITRVQRHDADESAPATPEDLVEGDLGQRPDASGRATLLPALGTGAAARANFETIAQQERLHHGRLELAQLFERIRQLNAPMIDQLGVEGAAARDQLLMRQVNQGNDLDALIRLNERLCFRIDNAEGLETDRQEQEARIEPEHEARVRAIEDDVRVRQAQIDQLGPEIDRARDVVDLDAQMRSLQREQRSLSQRIRDKTRQVQRARRADVRERMQAQIEQWNTRKREVDARLAQLAARRAEAATREREGRVTTRIGDPAMRERLARLERRRDLLEDEIDELQQSAGYYLAHPGTRQQLIGAHPRERGEGTQRERITGRLTAVRPELPWAELITPGEPGLAAQAQRARREAHPRRRGRHR